MWKIYNAFYVSLLEQNTTKKRQVNNTLPESEKFEAGDNKEFEIEAIIYSTVNGKKINNQIPNLYYLVLWKGYPKKKASGKCQ